MSFELAAAAGIVNVKNETVGIDENVVLRLGTAGKQVKNETETITENVIPGTHIYSEYNARGKYRDVAFWWKHEC